jgi:hypothetical protein
VINGLVEGGSSSKKFEGMWVRGEGFTCRLTMAASTARAIQIVKRPRGWKDGDT